MGLINLTRIRRRRHGDYAEPEQSRRQATVCYSLTDEHGEFIRVCKKTFMDTFAISKKKIDILVSKKKMGETSFVDRRTNHRLPKFTEEDRLLVRTHINLIPRDVGHYSRAKSNKEYISPDLNIHRLFKAFQEMHRNSAVTYKFYRSVFIKDFPNVCFRRPRVDTCNLCDKLQCEIRANIASSQTASMKLELHHRKAEKSRSLMNEDMIESQQPGSEKCSLSMDLQQVMFVPTLTHADMFYASQLSCYNFGIHIGDTNDAYMYMWHEGVSGRGSNEIASCLLHLLNSGITQKKHLVIWCDNCGGQNKNKVLLFTMIFLVANGLVASIEQRFLVSGHSFIPCDRDFALIEKRKRVMKAFVPADLHEVVASARYNPPFKIVDMTQHGFWDLKSAAERFLNTTKLKISRAVALRVESSRPCFIKLYTSFSDVASWDEINVLKKGETLTALKNTELLKLPPENKISANKRASLISMIDFLEKQEQKEFYKKLLDVQLPSVPNSNLESTSQQAQKKKLSPHM